LPSPDVDIVATRTGRLVAVELDGNGFSTRVSYSDDSGQTWTASKLAALGDQDRPWLAVGPDDPATKKPRVYLLFHNLFTAYAIQDMFVSTSSDGGATFGAPVPIVSPDSSAFLDLQCADSSGPSGIAVNHKTGRVYAVWGTRSSKAGGCGAQVVSGPLQFSIESPTRIWVATSSDGRAGSWTVSLAVDDSATGNVVGMLWSPVAVDRAGNVYVAYPETPHGYPDYAGAAIRYRWAPADLSRWSRPVTVAASVRPGHLLAHLVAGDRGKLDFAYMSGAGGLGTTTGWFATAAQTLDGLAASPHITQVTLSKFPSYTGTAADMAGACAKGPTAGIQQGLVCTRAADNFGLTLDASCRLLVAWPAIETNKQAGHLGTWVSVQTSGPTLC
jgi:hypothetical protein